MPTWLKVLLGIVGGGAAGGVIGFLLSIPLARAIIQYLEKARPRDEVREFNVMAAVIGVPTLCILVGAIIGAVLLVVLVVRRR